MAQPLFLAALSHACRITSFTSAASRSASRTMTVSCEMHDGTPSDSERLKWLSRLGRAVGICCIIRPLRRRASYGRLWFEESFAAQHSCWHRLRHRPFCRPVGYAALWIEIVLAILAICFFVIMTFVAYFCLPEPLPTAGSTNTYLCTSRRHVAFPVAG